MDSWIEVYEYLVTVMRDAQRRADYYRQETERLKDRVAELSERGRAAGGCGRHFERREERALMTIKMRFTKAERAKWVRMMSRIRNLCRESGTVCRISTRRLADGSREGQITW